MRRAARGLITQKACVETTTPRRKETNSSSPSPHRHKGTSASHSCPRQAVASTTIPRQLRRGVATTLRARPWSPGRPGQVVAHCRLVGVSRDHSGMRNPPRSPSWGRRQDLHPYPQGLVRVNRTIGILDVPPTRTRASRLPRPIPSSRKHLSTGAAASSTMGWTISSNLPRVT